MTSPRICTDCPADIAHRHWRSQRCQRCQHRRERLAMNTKAPTLYGLTCEHCHTPFRAANPRQRFCGNRCSGSATHPGNVALACPVCDAPFSISVQFAAGGTCSRACARWQRLHPGRKRASACGRCGGPIDRPNINAEYCSTLCAAVAGQARREGRGFVTRRQFCLSCGQSIEGRTARALFCRRGCQAAAQKNRRAAKVAGAPVERVYPIDVYERDHWCCHLCGAPIDPLITERYHPERVSLDHVIAVNAPDFPGHVWANLAAAHLGCNIAKGDAVSAHDRALYARLSAEGSRLTI